MMTKYKLMTLGTLFSLISAMPAFSAPTKANASNNPFVELNGELVTVQGAITSLQDQIDALIGRVDSVEARVTASEGAIAALQQQDLLLQYLIDQNILDISSIYTNITFLEESNLSLQSQIDENSGYISTLQADINTNNGLIINLQNAIILVEEGSIDLGVSLQAQIDNNGDLIATIEAELEVINSTMATHQMIVSGNCPVGQSIREIESDGSVICEVDDFGGAEGMVSQYRVFKSINVAANNTGDVRLTCPSGFALTGGGFTHSLGNTRYLFSYPNHIPNADPEPNGDYGRTWRVVASPAQYPGYLNGYAVCISHG